MNKLQKILLGGLIIGVGSCTETEKVKNNASEKIFNEIQDTCVYENQKDTNEQEILKVLGNDNKIYESTIDSLEIDPEKEIKTVYIDSIKKGPLFMRGTRRHIGEFLGYNQYQNIIKKYNNPEILQDTTFQKNPSVLRFNNINFPLIADGLEKELPNTIGKVMEDTNFSELKDSIKTDGDLILITNIGKNGQERYALGYYVQGNLYIATEVSIGRGENTPDGLFNSGMRYPRNKSRKYRNAPMPYTIQIQGNICMHQGKVTGKKLSHGCIRVPGLYQLKMYETMKDSTKIIIKKYPTIKEDETTTKSATDSIQGL